MVIQKNQIESLFSSYDEKQMAAYKISKEVNSSKNHRHIPEILNPVMDSGSQEYVGGLNCLI